MRAVQIGGIVLFFALIGAALGLAFFRQVDGENLRVLVREKVALQQQVAKDDNLIKILEGAVGGFPETLALRDARISKLEGKLDNDHRDLINLHKEIRELKEVSKRDLTQRDMRIKELLASLTSLNSELDQRNKRITELEMEVEKRR